MAQQHPESERGNVARPVTQRGDAQREDVEAVKQVLAEPSGGGLGGEIAVGRGDDPHIDLERPGRAQGQHLAFLQRAQQLGLQGERQFADLVEQQRALVGGAEQPLARLGRAGEGTLAVAEQQRFEHRFGHGGAIDRHEGTLAARREAVDEAREHFLAGAGRAFEQDGNVTRRDAFGQRQQRERLRVAGDRPAAVRRCGEQGGPRGFGRGGIIGERDASRSGERQRGGGGMAERNRGDPLARQPAGQRRGDRLAQHDPLALPRHAHQRHGDANQSVMRGARGFRLRRGCKARRSRRWNVHAGPCVWSG